MRFRWRGEGGRVLRPAPGLRPTWNVSGVEMKGQYIRAEESFREWHKDPEYLAEFDALEDEFAVASALIKARDDATMARVS